MSATDETKIIDGKVLAAQLKEELTAEVKARIASGRSRPGLATVIVGDNPGLQSICPDETARL